MRSENRSSTRSAVAAVTHERWLNGGSSLNPLALIGRWFLALLAGLGELTLFAGRAVVHGIMGPYYTRVILRHMIDIG